MTLGLLAAKQSETAGAQSAIARKRKVNDGDGFPSWLDGAVRYRWVEVPNSTLSKAPGWNDYGPTKGTGNQTGLYVDSGAAVKASGSEFFLAGGGHADYAGNEVFTIRLADSHPGWVRRNLPTPPADIPWNANPERGTPASHYSDGRPAARHTYWQMQFCDQRNLLMFHGASAVYSQNAISFNTVDAFDPETNDYLPRDTFKPKALGTWGGLVVKVGNGDILQTQDHSGAVIYWTQATDTWSSIGVRGRYSAEHGTAWDSNRNRAFHYLDSGDACFYYDLSRPGFPAVNVRLTGEQWPSRNNRRGSMVYCPAADAYFALLWGNPKLYRIDAATFEVSIVPTTGTLQIGLGDPGSNGYERFYGRFNYLPELKALVFALKWDLPLRVMRTV